MGNLLPEEPGEPARGMGSDLRAKAAQRIRELDSRLLAWFERPGPRRAASWALLVLLVVEAPVRWLDKPVAMLLAGIQVRERKRRGKYLDKDR